MMTLLTERTSATILQFRGPAVRNQLALADIPFLERQKIAEALERAGMPASKENIQALWCAKLRKGGDLRSMQRASNRSNE
jgi:hypothetical protein